MFVHRTLHGLQSREVDHYLDMLAGWGFNALRLPISLRMALDLGGHVKIRHNKWMPAKQLIEVGGETLQFQVLWWTN